MRTLGTKALRLYQDERCLHLTQRFSPDWMRLGIASKAKRELADNKLFIKALASLSLKNVSILFSHIHRKIITEQKEYWFAFVIRGKNDHILDSKLLPKILKSNRFFSDSLFKIYYYDPLFIQSPFHPSASPFPHHDLVSWVVLLSHFTLHVTYKVTEFMGVCLPKEHMLKVHETKKWHVFPSCYTRKSFGNFILVK